jgi:hypothetical protein
MSWNHRSKIAAVAIVIQSVAGAFSAPNTTTDLMGVSNLTNTGDMYSAQDPTLSGAIWDVQRIYLGRTETIGFTLPCAGLVARRRLRLAHGFPAALCALRASPRSATAPRSPAPWWPARQPRR